MTFIYFKINTKVHNKAIICDFVYYCGFTNSFRMSFWVHGGMENWLEWEEWKKNVEFLKVPVDPNGERFRDFLPVSKIGESV